MTEHKIVTIIVAGGVYAQGETAEPLDPRGFIQADMHGYVEIRDGKRILVGKPIEPVRSKE